MLNFVTLSNSNLKVIQIPLELKKYISEVSCVGAEERVSWRGAEESVLIS